MNVKKILSLAVVLAMVLTVVPAFGVFAATATDATKWELTFNTPAPVTGFGDVQILDADGDVVTGFCIAGDGLFPFHREQVKDKETSVADYNGTVPEEFSNTPEETQVGYDANTEVKITYEKVDGGYKVTYTATGAYDKNGDDKKALDSYSVSRTYATDVEINGVTAPNSWWLNNQGNGIDLSNANIAEKYILNAKVDGQAVEAPAPATITVQYLFEDGTDVKAATSVEGLYVGGHCEVYDINNPTPIEKDGAKYLPAKDTANPTVITSLKETNNIVFKYTKVDGFKTVDVPEEVVYDHDRYAITSENFVENPSFETSDGRFDIEGWNSAEKKDTFGESGANHSFAITKTGYSGINGNYNFVATDAYPPQDGEAAYGGRWNDGEKGLCSIYKNTTVEKNKTYYVSYWVRANDCDEGRAQVLAVSGNAEPSGTKDAGNVISTAKYGEWTKVETIVSTDDTNDTIQFHAWRLGSGNADGGSNNGSHPYIMFDNFVIAEVELTEAGKDIKAEFKDGDTVVYSETHKILSDESYTVSSKTVVVKSGLEGIIYEIPETVVNANVEVPVTPAENVENVILPSTTFFYNFMGAGERITEFGGDHGDIKNSSNLASVGWGNVRGGVMAFEGITAPAEGKLAVMNLHINAPYNWGDAKLYAIDPSKLLADNKIDYDGSGLVADKASDEIPKVLEALGAIEEFVDISNFTGSKSFNIDLTPYFEKYPDADKVVFVMFSTSGQTYVYGNDLNVLYLLDQAPYMTYDIIDVPEAPAVEARLGWNGEKFTIDYVPTDEITPIKGATYAVDVTASVEGITGGVYDPAKDAGVGIVPKDTNDVYSATSKVAVGGKEYKAEAAVKAGIYGLVMQAIVDSALEVEINKAQLDVVNEVLKNGNILLTNGELTEAAAKVMTLSEDKPTITLTDQAVKLGLRFAKDIGAGTNAEVAPVTATVSDDGKSVTLPVDADAAEAMVLSLESVYLEFVPTEMADAADDDADAVQDFIPEL